MNPRQLYEAGKLDEAIQALGARLREDPTDSRSRTFLFELLCFSGAYDRAEKQLDVLARGSQDAAMGALLYRAALHAERSRLEMFEGENFPALADPPRPPSGTLNGKRFETLEDADVRIGARLEVFAAGQYMWIPMRSLASVHIDPPQRLRDLLWAPARVVAGPDLQDFELGEVLLPVVTPLAFRHPDPLVRLGRTTDLVEEGDDTILPAGHKLFLADDETIPLLDIRELIIDQDS